MKLPLHQVSEECDYAVEIRKQRDAADDGRFRSSNARRGAIANVASENEQPSPPWMLVL
jgi:hypothetical protein